MFSDIVREIFGHTESRQTEWKEEDMNFSCSIDNGDYITFKDVIVQAGNIRYIRKNKETGHALLVLHSSDVVDTGETFDDVKEIFV